MAVLYASQSNSAAYAGVSFYKGIGTWNERWNRSLEKCPRLKE